MRTVNDYVLALGMLITGSINTITTKLADQQRARGAHGDRHLFTHPFFQADGMFLGEFSCLLAFAIMCKLQSRRDRYTSLQESGDSARRPTSWSPLVFLPPALCDMTGTSCMYIGLTMTSASIFQMLRGSVVLFTGIFSYFFLGRKLFLFHITGMIFVLIGTAIVGLSSVLDPDDSSGSNPVVGNIIIVVAQLVVATQMVLEEKFVQGRDIHPLAAVGCEGMWGFSIMSCLLVVFYRFPPLNGLSSEGAGHHFENSIDAFLQIRNSRALLFAVLGNVVSIAFFNFFGIAVTKNLSATHRMVLDSVRTSVVWGFSLSLKWEKFDKLQLFGFLILIIGTSIYNEIVKIPFLTYPESTDDSLQEPLLQDSENTSNGYPQRVVVDVLDDSINSES